MNSIQKHQQEIFYLESFLKILVANKTNRTTENNNNSINTEIDGSENTLYTFPAALIQLMILLTVLIAVYFVCTCNKIMMTCRENLPHSFLPFYLGDTTSDDISNETIDCKHIICYLCYECKVKKRYKNRRVRNQRFNRNIKTKQLTRVSSLYRNRITNNSSNFRMSNKKLSESTQVKQKSLQRDFNSVRFVKSNFN